MEAKNFWARVVINHPFMMGFSPNQHMKKKVSGEPFRVGGLKFFAHHESQKVSAYEATTGGFMTTSRNVVGLQKKIKHLLSITPDFKTQMESLPSLNELEVYEEA